MWPGLKCQVEESGCLEMMEALLIVRFTIDQLVDIYLYFSMRIHFMQCELILLWVDYTLGQGRAGLRALDINWRGRNRFLYGKERGEGNIFDNN